MEDVKELKRLLYLAKMKFRNENPDLKNYPQKGFKIKRKVKKTRKTTAQVLFNLVYLIPHYICLLIISAYLL